MGATLIMPRVYGASLRDRLLVGVSHHAMVTDIVQRERIARAAALRDLSEYSRETAGSGPAFAAL